MPDAPGHLSIGEVLSLLQSEFEDITISKIRFLESQGLIDPERTPSGYRKFYDGDIARLRWVLRQQRDHFLPLKVIKAKLEQGAVTDFDDDRAAGPNLFAQEADDPAAPAAAAPSDAGGLPVAEPRSDGPATGPVPHGAVAPSEGGTGGNGPSDRDPGAWLAELQEAPRRAAGAPAGRPVAPAATGDGLTFGLEEVAQVTGVDPATIEALVTYGLIAPQRIGGEPAFDATAVSVVRTVARFLERGIEARHLRIFKNAADREAGFFEQLILPLLKQRNPRSRELAQEQLTALVGDGEELHRVLVHHALRAHLP